jgi:hypothetical protein
MMSFSRILLEFALLDETFHRNNFWTAMIDFGTMMMHLSHMDRQALLWIVCIRVQNVVLP